MNPAEVLSIGGQIKASLAAAEDAPPEAVLLLDLVLGMAFNLAILATPPVMAISSGDPA